MQFELIYGHYLVHQQQFGTHMATYLYYKLNIFLNLEITSIFESFWFVQNHDMYKMKKKYCDIV